MASVMHEATILHDYAHITHTSCEESGEGFEKPLLASTCCIVISQFSVTRSEDYSECCKEELLGCKLGEEVEIKVGFGTSQLSDVVDACVEQMKCGEVSCFKIQLDKDLDTLNHLDTFQFTIKLISFSSNLELYERSFPDLLEIASQLKVKAGECFKSRKTHTAAVLYVKALKVLISGSLSDCAPEERERSNNLKTVLHLNIAACQLKRELYSQAWHNCSAVLERQPDSIKALYRRGKSSLMMNDFDEAEKDILALLRLDADNKDSKELHGVWLKKRTESNRVLGSRLRNMFI